MAYTNLGTVTWDSRPDITVVFDYDYKRSGSDMQYKVRVTVNTLPTSISTFGYPIYATISLDGVKKVSKHTIKNASPNYWTDPYVYETDWLTVSGKTSGNTALSVNLYSIYGSDAAGTGTRDKTYSYNLTVSPSASIPTAEASIVELGGSVKIYTNRRDNTFYHRIGCKFGSYTHWGKDIFDDDIAQSWFLFSPPISLASQIPNSTSGTCTIYLTTYSDATCTKQVGETQSMTLTLTVPASVKPTISSVALSDEAGYLDTFSAYVQGKSRLKLNATASQAYGSPIKSYTFIVDGKTTAVTSNEAIVDLPNAGTIPVIVRVTDGRGRVSTDHSTTITVLQYSTPKINSVSAVRCQSDGTEDTAGTYVKVTFSGTISPLSNVNAATWKVQRRKQSATSWSSSTVTPSDRYNPAGISTIVSGIVADSAYVFRIRATDTVTGNVYSVEIPVPAGFALFKTNAQLNGLTFGRETVKENTLGVAWDMEVDGKLNVAGHIGGNYIQGTWLQSTAHTDLNKVPTSYPVFDGGGWIYHRTKDEMLSDLGIFPFKVAVCTKASTTQSAVNDYWSIRCPAETGYTRIVAGIRTGEPASIIVKNYDFNGDYIRVYTQNTSGASKTFAISVEVLFIPDVNITLITT